MASEKTTAAPAAEAAEEKAPAVKKPAAKKAPAATGEAKKPAAKKPAAKAGDAAEKKTTAESEAKKPAAPKAKAAPKAAPGPKAQTGMLKVTLKRGLSGCTQKQIAVAASLGLRRVNDTKTQPDNAATAGKIAKIGFLLTVSKA